MTFDQLFRTSLKRTAEMVIPLANSKNLQIISSVNLYEMDFGALEGDYVVDYLPYPRITGLMEIRTNQYFYT